MTIYPLILLFIFGLIIGSFLNVVIYRYNTGKSINGRSGCMTCGKQLYFWELLPVFSYIFLRGKCAECKTKISMQYPLVELATGTSFVFLALHFNNLFLNNISYFALMFSMFAIIFSILIVIFVYDLRHKIIPDGLVFAFAILTLIYQLLNFNYESPDLLNWLNLFAGFILFIPFFTLWLFSGGRWIGLGDGKLAIGIGWMLGFIHGITAVILAFWIGALVSVALVLIAKLKAHGMHITMKSEIPFAPFLILGLIIVFFFPFDVFNISLLFI